MKVLQVSAKHTWIHEDKRGKNGLNTKKDKKKNKAVKQ